MSGIEDKSHDQHIGSAQNFGANGRAVGDRLVSYRRTQIGKNPERLAQAEDARLGTQLSRQSVVLRAADGTQKHGVAFETSVAGTLWKRLFPGVDRRAPDRVFAKFKLITVYVGDGAEHPHGFLSHFRSNPVPGQNSDFQLHCINAVERLPSFEMTGFSVSSESRS